jgi:hypothetical protein
VHGDIVKRLAVCSPTLPIVLNCRVLVRNKHNLFFDLTRIDVCSAAVRAGAKRTEGCQVHGHGCQKAPHQVCSPFTTAIGLAPIVA